MPGDIASLRQWNQWFSVSQYAFRHRIRLFESKRSDRSRLNDREGTEGGGGSGVERCLTVVDIVGRMSTDVVIVGAARTPIGRYGGAFRDVQPAELGAVAVRAALQRATLEADLVDEVLVGHARQAGSGPNPARQVGKRSGIPDTAPAQTINKACASGMQAIASGAQAIMLGESQIVVAGGIEAMSRMPYLIDAEDARWGR